MRILAITDVHGNKNFDEKIENIAKDVDLILIAGDITNFGDEKEALTIIESIQRLNEKILAVPGNCDYHGVNDALVSQGIDLHKKMKKIGDIIFYGMGGCSKTPFNTPQEYSESEIEISLQNFKEKDARYEILVSHSPPAETRVDRTVMGIHVGSKAVRAFIEKHQPDFVICGHIHEARGEDRIGDSIIINPGPFPKHYAVIDIDNSINYELF